MFEAKKRVYARTTGQKGDGAIGKRIVQEGALGKEECDDMWGKRGKVKCKEGGQYEDLGNMKWKTVQKAG